MFKLYQKLSERFPEWKFGYNLDQDNITMHLSISNPTFTYVKNRTIAAGLPLKEYAEAYAEMLRELKAPA